MVNVGAMGQGVALRHPSQQHGSRDRPESAAEASAFCSLSVYPQAYDCQRHLRSVQSREKTTGALCWVIRRCGNTKGHVWHLNQNLERLHHLLTSRGRTISCGGSQGHALVESRELNCPRPRLG